MRLSSICGLHGDGTEQLYPCSGTDRIYWQFYNNTHHLLDFF
jgi:hypothetical protein